MDRADLLAAWLIANARGDKDQARYLLENLTEEFDSDGCFTRAEVDNALQVTREDLRSLDEDDEELDFEDDEEEGNEVSYDEILGNDDDWD